MGLSTVSIFKSLNSSNDKLRQITPTELRKLQRVLLDMMKDINSVCKKHNINCMLGGGSCLGAVRHNGFIPWDDDIDLDIPRQDYDKFVRVFQKELGDKYWLHTQKNKPSLGLGFTRIRKKGTVLRAREDFDNDGENGIYIDVFTIENTYNSRIMRNIHGFLSLSIGFILSCRKFYSMRKQYMELAGEDKKVKKVFRKKILLGLLFAWLPVSAWARLWDNINKMCKNHESKYVVVPVGRRHFFGEMYYRKDFCVSIEHKFEDTELLIPIEYDGYLKNMYGDYMKIPPEADRETHIFYELDFGEEEKRKKVTS